MNVRDDSLRSRWRWPMERALPTCVAPRGAIKDRGEVSRAHARPSAFPRAGRRKRTTPCNARHLRPTPCLTGKCAVCSQLKRNQAERAAPEPAQVFQEWRRDFAHRGAPRATWVTRTVGRILCAGDYVDVCLLALQSQMQNDHCRGHAARRNARTGNDPLEQRRLAHDARQRHAKQRARRALHRFADGEPESRHPDPVHLPLAGGRSLGRNALRRGCVMRAAECAASAA